MVVVKSIYKDCNGVTTGYLCEDGFSSQRLTKEQLAYLIGQGLVENAKLYYRNSKPCIRVTKYGDIESQQIYSGVPKGNENTAIGLIAKLNEAMFDMTLSEKSIILNKCKIDTPVINIPYGVTHLATGCFNGLTKVNTVIIPTSCKKVGTGIFDNDSTKSIKKIVCAESTSVKCRFDIELVWLSNTTKKNISINRDKPVKNNDGIVAAGTGSSQITGDSIADKIEAIKRKKKKQPII